MLSGLRGLTHFWRPNLAVALGAAVASTVLTGALLAGDSVRGSLVDLTLNRLGGIDAALVSEGFFREELGKPGAYRTAPLIVSRATAVHGSSARRAAGVAVYGVDERFTRLYGQGAGLPELRQEQGIFPPVAINEALARELGASAGDDVLLSLELPGEIPRESLLGDKDAEDALVTQRFTLARVLPDRGLGGFSLAPHQARPRNAFISLAGLQRIVGRPGRVNALVAAGEPPPLRPAVRLEDLGLRVVRGPGHVSLESEGFFLKPEAVEAAASAKLTSRVVDERDPSAASGPSLPRPLSPASHPPAGREGSSKSSFFKQSPSSPGGRGGGWEKRAGVMRVFTYLATGMRANGRLLPYSMVAGLSAMDGLALADGQILLNQWAAEDLSVQPGDPVELSYLVMAPGGGLVEERTVLRLAGVVGMTGLGADRTLTPTFPGIEDAEDMAAWNPPFPVDLSRIRPKDEDYWDDYGAAPKAFVSLATARRLWSTRFGDLTALRFEAGEEDLDRIEETLRRELPARVDFAAFGLVFQPVKRQGLTAAQGSTDFAGLFLAFSFFLVVSAVLLAGLLFSLAVERRVGELGTLLAAGYPVRKVRRRLLAEGTVLAGAGALLGLAGACGYAWLLMAGLRTWWLPAVGTSELLSPRRGDEPGRGLDCLRAGGARRHLLDGAAARQDSGSRAAGRKDGGSRTGEIRTPGAAACARGSDRRPRARPLHGFFWGDLLAGAGVRRRRLRSRCRDGRGLPVAPPAAGGAPLDPPRHGGAQWSCQPGAQPPLRRPGGLRLFRAGDGRRQPPR